MLDNSAPQNNTFFKFPSPETALTHTVNFLVQSSVSRFAVDGCCELLEVANKIAGKQFYRINVIEDAASLSGIPISSFGQTAILFGHSHAPWRLTEPVSSTVRARMSRFSRVGFIGGAVFLSDQLFGQKHYSLAVHSNLREAAQECQIDFADGHPTVHQSRNALSAIGGIAALHLMCRLIAEDLGEMVSQATETYVGLAKSRDGCTPALKSRYLRAARGNQMLTRSIELMFEHIENPLNSRTLTEKLNCSTRQLERVFQSLMGTSPMSTYRDIRLDHARQLLMQTDLPLVEVYLATGFSNRSNFTHCFKERFGMLPLSVRARHYFGVQAD